MSKPQPPQNASGAPPAALAALLAPLCPWQPWDDDSARVAWLCRQLAVPAELLGAAPGPDPAGLPIASEEP